MVITWKIIYVITPHVSSFIFSVKMIKHKIHMNSKVARNLLLLCIHLSLRAKNCWRLITYFAFKLIHVITPHISSFIFSVKMINHKIHMNCVSREVKLLENSGLERRSIVEFDWTIMWYVSSFIFSLKMMKHKIHIHILCIWRNAKPFDNSKVARNLLLLFVLGQRRQITYFACKIIHVIIPHVSSFSVSVKMINHKIHMNCFNGPVKCAKVITECRH